MIKKISFSFKLSLLALSISTSAAHSDGFRVPEAYKEIVPADYRQSYSRVTGFEFSGLHWKQWITIYIDKNADVYKNNYLAYLSAYVDDEDDDEDEEGESSDVDFVMYDRGTVFLKEHYSDADNLPETALTLTLMIKREKDYDPQGGDWEYVQSSQDGQILMVGNSSDPQIKSACQSCHSNMAERDYIFSTYYSGDH